jgi:hypothetical protein
MVEAIPSLTAYRDRLDAVVTAFSHFLILAGIEEP